ncbi:MAG: endonuclease/exonuclease/phosphatase family protein [Candidatus Kariarchaeaceae archaeon]|jgi:predicted extracellular nuclease
MNHYYIAWWNVENLFDTKNSQTRPAKLKNKLKKFLKDWTQDILDLKIKQLVRVIAHMNDHKGPDLLGVCEVENKAVMTFLVNQLKIETGRNYEIEHHDTEDGRGIDVGFIYDTDRLESDLTFHHFILKRNATRDLFQVNFKTKPGENDLIVVGNHWPARSAGQYKSEPYRILAAETLAYWHERILEEKGEDVAIIFMGDFNDQPFDRSLVEYALSTPNRKSVTRAKTPKMYNLMWDLLQQGDCTYYYGGGYLILDQFMTSKGFIKRGTPFSVKEETVQVYNFDPQTNKKKRTPKKFSNKPNLNKPGYSDHFPICMIIGEKGID